MIIKSQKKGPSRVNLLKNYILGGLCAALALASILLTIEVATSGAEVASLEKTEKNLAEQKRDLEEALVKNLSTSELQQKSGELGFIKPETMVYISEVPPVAKLP